MNQTEEKQPKIEESAFASRRTSKGNSCDKSLSLK